jgi:outer membrane protein OmpA-like peptidoglycan-associated protein
LGRRFGHDFSNVRVHSDEAAARSARALHARAYTVGQHIVFSDGEFAPRTQSGSKLLVHEAVHTIQQRGTTAGDLQSMSIDAPHSRAEREAEEVEHRSAAGAIVRFPATRSGPVLQRQPLPGAPDLQKDIHDLWDATRRGSFSVNRFATGSAQVPESELWKLDSYADTIINLLAAYPDSTVDVTGHTDTVGTAESNMELGMARAQTVAAELVERQVPAGIIATKSAGEGPPQAVPTSDNTDSPANRRVVVDFNPKGRPLRLELPQPPQKWQPVPQIDPGSVPGVPTLPRPWPGAQPEPGWKPGPRTMPGLPGLSPDVMRKIQEIEAKYKEIDRIINVVARNEVIRKLRNIVATLPFWPSKEEALATLDKAIEKGTAAGVANVVKSVVEAMTGKKANEPRVFPQEPGQKIYGPTFPF